MRPSHIRLFEHDPVGLDTPPPSGSGGSTDGGSAGRAARPPAAERVETNTVSAAYAQAFAQIQEALRAGDTYEANLTYRTAVHTAADPVETYLRLRSINPAPYAGFLQHDVAGHATWLLSSSPERYALIDADRTIETRPIKGTTPRGATDQEDAANAEHLRTDPKLRSENLMITDLLRNDLAMVCEPGTVDVPGLMRVESYPSVHQLVSTVRGRLRDEITTIEALRRLFPAGSMTGAPKLRTMEIIERAEQELGGPRAAYAGAFGWISGDGPADLGVVIRTLTTHDTRTWQIGTGGGITVRSDVAEEAAEARLKADRVRASLDR
nr:anthranilate synthase component I family protein [Nocardioides panzhihuensis]